MQKWLTATPAIRLLTRPHRTLSQRWYSSQQHVETVAVRCASSGSISINLHNVAQHPRSHPLVIYLPPFFHTRDTPVPTLPAFLRPYPSVVINYRWLDPSTDGNPIRDEPQPQPPPFQWPTPIHDTLFGYSWVLKNLAPPGDERRDVYVYGSYLGASLAASLALTEARHDQRMAVQGLLTYNGIYNWTTFLPDHPIHQRKSLADALDDTAYADGSFFHYLRNEMPLLFPSPSGLFDPFASPSLLFRDPGLWVPEDFATPVTPDLMTRAIDALSPMSPASETGEDADADSVSSSSTAWSLKPPPKSYLKFPPSGSTLKIPEALLLYESPPPRPYVSATRKRKQSPKTAKKRKISNNFEGQATELSNLMRRSVEKYELSDRGQGDEDAEGVHIEAAKRVQTRDVGAVEGDGTLGEAGQAVADAWLRERTGTVGRI